MSVVVNLMFIFLILLIFQQQVRFQKSFIIIFFLFYICTMTNMKYLLTIDFLHEFSSDEGYLAKLFFLLWKWRDFLRHLSHICSPMTLSLFTPTLRNWAISEHIGKLHTRRPLTKFDVLYTYIQGSRQQGFLVPIHPLHTVSRGMQK